MIDVAAYIALSVLAVAIGGGPIGLGLCLVWIGLAIIAWERVGGNEMING